MHDDPRRNLKWLEQQLLAEDSVHRDFSKLPDKAYHKDDDLLERVDRLIGEEDPPARNFANNYGRTTKAERSARAQAPKGLEEKAYVPVKTKKQLRREAKAARKAGVNHNIKGLVFLAILEILGILAILGWWLQ